MECITKIKMSYNDKFKLTFRDTSGLVVTVIADTTCTQKRSDYRLALANLPGHRRSRWCHRFPSYDLGEELIQWLYYRTLMFSMIP